MICVFSPEFVSAVSQHRVGGGRDCPDLWPLLTPGLSQLLPTVPQGE